MTARPVMAEEALRTTTFTLSSADALAYEQAAFRLNPLGTVALALWLGICGAAAWLIPPDWSGAQFGWSFSILVSLLVAIGYVLALLVVSFRQWLGARRRLGRAAEVTLTEWAGRLDIVAAGLPSRLSFSEIRESILTRTHLFLVSDSGVVIVPHRAFAEEGVVEALAARIAGRPVAAPVDADARAA